ncbi:hypothetical protein BJF90_15705 [Pseudonocardia sp. CNS-004]|nr:hypothetical protein BJF90_15705 [Pseudonocardia sp. CNS-004]
MLAARYYGRRDVRIERIEDAATPRHDEVRLRVLRAAICGTDVAEFVNGPSMIPINRPHPGSGHHGPLTLGHEFVGEIEAVGSGVEGFSVGQRVVPGAGVWCGACEWCRGGRTNLCARYYTHGLQADGGLAEFVTVPARMCRYVPAGLDDDTAAIAQPLAVALHGVRRGNPEAGQAMVLIGLGGIGHFALRALASSGPSVLVAVDVDDVKLERALAEGATHAVNARGGDVVELVRDLTDGAGAHLVVEASGARPSPALATALARRGGSVVLLGLQKAPTELDLSDMVLREIDLITTVAHVCDVDLPRALELLADPRSENVVIDRVIPLESLVEEGLIPLHDGAVLGKVVVRPH